MVLSTIWRLSCPANAATGNASVGVSEVEMRATPGGADQCSGGTAGASAGTAANGFDNNTGTQWSTSDTNATWLQYTFASAVEVRELVITGHSTAAQSPNSFTFDYWNETLGVFIPAISQSGLSWTASEVKTFAVPSLEDLVDSVGMGEATAVSQIFVDTLVDGVRAFAFIDRFAAYPASLSETVTIADGVSYVLGAVLAESIIVGLSSVENQKSQVALADALSLLEQLNPGTPITISEAVTITLTQLAQQAVEVIEALDLDDVLVPIFKYNQSVIELVSLASSLANFFGEEITESIAIAETIGAVAARGASISELVTLSEALTPRLVLRVTVEDELEIEDVDVLNMIYSGTIAEGIEITAAYLSPGDGITTWAMNTRTGAVTEYSNYAFNSFAQMGHKYLGASQDGLYELVGDDDAGVDIIAEIKSGFAQWAGARFTMFSGIYLAVRGDGNFVLKLTTGDGKTYHYAVSARSQRTTKVHIGKGLKARYWAFELISTGQDFDLDTLEFVPLVSGRRV